MKKILALSLVSVFVATPVLAAEQGAYVAADISTFNVKNLDTAVPGATIKQPTAGVHIAGGYNFTPMFGAEVGYVASGNGSVGFGTATANYNVTSTQVAAVGNFSFGDMFGMLVKLGYASNTIAGDATAGCTDCKASGMMYGIGAQFNINRHFGIRAQYESLGDLNKPASGTALTATTMSVGAVYSF